MPTTTDREATAIYFAYGSNMSVRRLRARVSSAVPLGVGWIADRRLRFHKRGRDGSGKCDIAPCLGRQAHGVLFAIDAVQVADLDRIEGVGRGYSRQEVDVHVSAERCRRAFTYRAEPEYIDAALKPYRWYRTHVIIGATEANLPAAYVREIEMVEAVRDPRADREASELGLYGAETRGRR